MPSPFVLVDVVRVDIKQIVGCELNVVSSRSRTLVVAQYNVKATGHVAKLRRDLSV